LVLCEGLLNIFQNDVMGQLEVVDNDAHIDIGRHFAVESIHGASVHHYFIALVLLVAVLLLEIGGAQQALFEITKCFLDFVYGL
jgi:hypothetical protein